MWKLVKACLVLLLVAVLAILTVAWLRFEKTANSAAHATLDEWPDGISWDRVSASLLPPGAVVHGLVVEAAGRGELLRSSRCRLPLRPGAWTGSAHRTGPPRLDGWTAIFRLPVSQASNWGGTLAGLPPSLPPAWHGRNGRIEIQLGEGEDLHELVLTAARMARPEPDAFRLKGRTDQDTDFDLAASREGETLRGTLRVGPLDAATWSSALLRRADGRVLGGTIALEADFTSTGASVDLKGTLSTRHMIVEGTGTPGPLEAALRRRGGTAGIPIALKGRLDHGADWITLFRSAVTAGARNLPPD